MYVSGIINSTFFRQDLSQISSVLRDYYPIIDTVMPLDDILIETMPDQVVRQKTYSQTPSFYYNITKPKNPPFTLILDYFKLPLKPLIKVRGLKGKKKCYLSKVDDEPYFKDADVYLYAPVYSFYVAEVKAYAKKYGVNVYTYSDELPDSFFEECGVIEPTNGHAKLIADVINNNLDGYITKNQFEKEIYSFFSQF